MFIATSNQLNIAFSGTLVTHINIRWYVATREMADVDGSIRIRQCSSNQYSFIFGHMVAKIGRGKKFLFL